MSKTSGKNKKRRKKPCRPVTEMSKKTVLKRTSAVMISKLHQLNRQKELVTKDSSLPAFQKSTKIAKIDQDINDIGGVEVYQHLSKSAESRYGGFNSAKWVMDQIRSLKIGDKKEGQLELLDVGALDLNYRKHKKTISCTAIDLNPQSAGITKADFLTFEASKSCIYDIVVLSLVINFCGDISSRGQMLRVAHRLCKVSGHLVVVLPLACLENSRYMTHRHFEAMLNSLGFDLVTSHNSRKLSFKLFRKAERTPDQTKYPKKELRHGVKLNNFSIVLS